MAVDAGVVQEDSLSLRGFGVAGEILARWLLLLVDPCGKVRWRLQRRRESASWHAACRNTARIGRGRGQAVSGSIHMVLTRLGITSILPARRGTQKLWSVSAEDMLR